ncbi:MAG: APC family permease [Planctomycetota bacterium]|jgi:APA family basic amino acid/polyamine antiporter
MTENSNNRDRSIQLVRGVTAFTAACVLVSNMIGSGIFGTTGYMARDIGSPSLILLLWLLGGIFAMLGALCYCELGAAMPRAGGEYIYISQAYGPIWGFLSGWTSFTIGFSAAIAVSAYLFASYLQQLSIGLQLPALHLKTIAILVVWLLTAIHVAGIKVGGFVQRLLTVIKVAAILILIFAGLAVGGGHWANLKAANPQGQLNLSIILVSFLFVTYSYSGWNAASYIAGEIADPQRNIPRATIWGTLCVGALYLALNLFYFYALPVTQLAAEPIEPVAQKSATALFGSVAAPWLTALLCVSILGAASAMIWVGPRVYYAMAQDGVFPAMFAQTTRSGGAPAKSIVLQSGWITVLILAGNLEQLFYYAGFVIIVFAALAVGAVVVLRIKNPNMDRPYRLRPYPLIPLLYLGFSLMIMWAVLYVKTKESLLGVLTVLAGIPVYLFWKYAIKRRMKP